MTPEQERKLIKKIASEMWGILNHDNDFDGNEIEDTYNRALVEDRLKRSLAPLFRAARSAGPAR